MTMYTAGFDRPSNGGMNTQPEGYASQFISSNPEPQNIQASVPCEPERKSDGILSKALDLFKGLELDDILIIAIGILLLLDGSEDNDILLIFLAIMLFT